MMVVMLHRSSTIIIYHRGSFREQLPLLVPPLTNGLNGPQRPPKALKGSPPKAPWEPGDPPLHRPLPLVDALATFVTTTHPDVTTLQSPYSNNPTHPDVATPQSPLLTQM
eukprot:626388-Pyramimonas_sp.AAC.2